MTVRGATNEYTTAGVTSDSSESRIAVMMSKKLRVINKSSGASRSPDTGDHSHSI